MVIEQLTSLGYGIIALGVMIGIGIVVLVVLGKNVANCPTGYTYNQNSSGTVFSDNNCCLNSGSTCSTAGNYTSPSTATQSMNTISTYLGTGSGGLATWIPIVIVMVIGLWFLGYFMVRKGKQA